MRIAAADLADPRVMKLLDYHLRQAAENSPPEAMFALDARGLGDPAVSVWAAWDGDLDSGALMGLGALKQLAPRHGEVKSMRTAPEYLRRGVAAALLAHLTGVALARGYTRLSLETGANQAFAPARALYEAAGFAPCEPFGDYVLTDFNRCYSKVL